MRSPTGFPTVAGLGLAATLLTVTLSGCGEGSTAADQFVGTWRYVDSQSTVQCLNSDPLAQPPELNKTFARGLGAEIVDLSVSPLERDRGITCDFAFDIAGAIATARPDQTCNLNSIDVLTLDPDASGKPQWTFTLNSPTTAEELVTSTIHIFHTSTTPGAPPVEETCSWSLIGHLTRISKD